MNCLAGVRKGRKHAKKACKCGKLKSPVGGRRCKKCPKKGRR